jgi:hypothetical protein
MSPSNCHLQGKKKGQLESMCTCPHQLILSLQWWPWEELRYPPVGPAFFFQYRAPAGHILTTVDLPDHSMPYKMPFLHLVSFGSVPCGRWAHKGDITGLGSYGAGRSRCVLVLESKVRRGAQSDILERHIGKNDQNQGHPCLGLMRVKS